MSLTVSYCCWLSLTISLSSMELLHISHFLPWLLAVSHSLTCPMELLHVFHCLLWLLAFSHCHTQCHVLSACHKSSLMVAGCLSLSLRSHGVAGSEDFLHVYHFFLWLLAVSNSQFQRHGVAVCLPLSPIVSGCLSLSFPVRRSCCMFLTVSQCCWLSLTILSGPMELLNFSHCQLLCLAHSHSFSQLYGVAAFLTLSLMVSGCLSLSLLSHGVSAFSHSLFKFNGVAACLSLSLMHAGCF